MKPLNLLVLFGILLLFPLWNSCLGGDCPAEPTTPTNVVAAAGDSQVTVSWQGNSFFHVYSEVQYSIGGGAGENCTE